MLFTAAVSDYRGLVVAGAVLIALMLVGAAGLMVLRRKLHNRLQATGCEAFTLNELRRLYRKGLLSDQEYERARARLIAKVKPESDSPGAPGETASENLGSPAGSSSS